MTKSPGEKLLTILQEHHQAREDGWLWAAFYRDGDDAGVVEQIEGDYEDPVEMARALATVINGVGADHCFISLSRSGGRPTEADRQLWRILRSLVSDDLLQDLVVFDRRGTWSMRGEDATEQKNRLRAV